MRLKESLSKVEGKFILSYNDNEYVRKLYKNYNIVEIERMSNMVKNEQRKPRYRELLIKNY